MPLSYRALSTPAIEPVSLDLAKRHLRVDDGMTDDDDYITALIIAARQAVEKLTNRAIYNRKMLLTLDYFPWPGWGSTTGSTAHDYFMHWYYRGLVIRLPLPGTVSVDLLTYLANDGVTVLTIDPSKYTVDTTSEPARIAPVPGYTWPYQTNFVPSQVRVNYTAGTYELAVSESFTVPAAAPYTYALTQASKLITFTGVTDGSGNPVTCTNVDGTLTFDASQAGKTLTASYTVDNCPQTIVFAMLLLIAHWYEHREAVSQATLTEVPLAVQSLLAGETMDSFGW
ncbi:MAG TPA: head-tail connector protein [Terracidiphilus sp.]|nr:head-tail connector protein [Terracidiphilus sp.]